MEGICNASKVLSQLVVLLLPLQLLGQVHISFLDDLLQILPSVLKGFHCEPSVWIGSNVKGLDLLVQGSQGLEVGFSWCQWSLELGVGFFQCSVMEKVPKLWIWTSIRSFIWEVGSCYLLFYLISSMELQRTGSVKSSSAFSNQELNALAFLAKVK